VNVRKREGGEDETGEEKERAKHGELTFLLIRSIEHREGRTYTVLSGVTRAWHIAVRSGLFRRDRGIESVPSVALSSVPMQSKFRNSVSMSTQLR
jgi:hypothetical protein